MIVLDDNKPPYHRARPLLYEGGIGMIDLASQVMCNAAKVAAVLLYEPETDTFLEDMTRNAD
jgi:hypothetical protein